MQGFDVTSYTLKVPGSDEEPYARAMLRRYPLDFRVIEHPVSDFLEEASDFVRVMEEPFHAPNVYTHYQLRRSMKQDGVHVVLAGSGGDEALAGYEAEFWPQARAELVRERRRLRPTTIWGAARAGAGLERRPGVRSRGRGAGWLGTGARLAHPRLGWGRPRRWRSAHRSEPCGASGRKLS
jgi:asparagine synthetase B (glutamine-hydrolysing)